MKNESTNFIPLQMPSWKFVLTELVPSLLGSAHHPRNEETGHDPRKSRESALEILAEAAEKLDRVIELYPDGVPVPEANDEEEER